MSEGPDEQRPERKIPLWGHISMFTLSMVMSAGLATSADWNPLQVVSALAFITTIPAMMVVWSILKINRTKTPDSLERQYTMAAYAALPWMGGGIFAIAVMRTLENKWAGMGIAAGMAVISTIVVWNLGKNTFAMLRRMKHRLEGNITPSG